MPVTGINDANIQADSYAKDKTKEAIRKAKSDIVKAYELAAENTKKDDWRNMSDKEWENFVDSIDKFIDAKKEELERREELQKEAAVKAAALAPAGMKTLAASEALLRVAANGFAGYESIFARQTNKKL